MTEAKELLLLWDIDGTIMRTKGAGRRAMNRAFEATFGIPNAFADITMHGRLDLNFMSEVFEHHNLKDTKFQDFIDLYYQALREEIQHETVELLPGVVEILKWTLRDGRLYNAIGTGNVEVGARIKLDFFELNEYFPVGGFCERPAERYEVLANGVEQAKAFYGVEFADTDVIVIGDTVKDIEAARKIGARVISVATGGDDYDTLRDEDPDLLLFDLTEFDQFAEFCGRADSWDESEDYT